MTRIIGGVLGSLKLKGPAKSTRPTSDRVKESIFSILESMDLIEGASVLDLYAGTGALGLEAASRGANVVTLIEADKEAFRVCEENALRVKKGLEIAGQNSIINVFRANAIEYLRKKYQANLIFVDPPYGLPDHKIRDLLNVLSGKEVTIVLERSSRSESPVPPGALSTLRQVSFGDTKVFILTLKI